MAYPTGTLDSTALATTINKIWSGSAINDFFKVELDKVIGFWTDYSSLVQNGGDTLHIPNLIEMTAYQKSTATTLTLSNPTNTETQLQINQWWYVAFNIEDMQSKQVLQAYVIQEKMIRNAAYTVAYKLATDLMSLYASLTTTVGTSTTAIVDSTIRYSAAVLDNNKIPKSDRRWFISPYAFWNQVMALDRFVLAINNGDVYSPVTGPVGGVGQIYGDFVVATPLVVLTSTNTVAHNIYAYKEAFCFAKTFLRLQSQYKLEYLSTLSVADVLYGVACQRTNAGVHVISTSGQ